MTSCTSINFVHEYMADKYWVFFCVFFMIVGSFFLLNLFVGVVISTFDTEQDKLGGNNLLSPKQREWIDIRLQVLRSTPIPKHTVPTNKVRFIFFKIAQHPFFEIFILSTILANTVVLAIKWY